jgi:glutamate formiminotransferase/glutamate formiminotransferase/formiminotetrahydrofolate cyclodeaminase
MLDALLEAIPNVSEGRDTGRLERLATAITRSGAALLDRTADPSHHRAVFTLAGDRATVERAAVALATAAAAEIDLRAHAGVHPRIGALDVLPFVPLGAATMDQAIATAHTVAHTIGETLGVPVFLYEAASRPPHRRSLESVRRGGLAGLAARLDEPAWRPDYGPGSLHPTAGAVAVGARGPLVAWNLVLDRPDLALARHIARTIRTSNGGLPCLKALGLPLAHTGQVQVSMNLTDYRTTSMADVFRAVLAESIAAGADLADSEIIGLVPRAALEELARAAPEVADRHRDQVLEDRLAARGLPAVGPADVR